MVSELFIHYLEESARISKQGKERALEILAEKEGNTIEVQRIKKKILMIKAKSWFGTLFGGYIVEKYYQVAGQI